MLPLRFPRLWLCLAWFFVLAALIASLAPPGASLGMGLVNDKVQHAVGYAALTTWFVGLYARSRYMWIALGLFVMGIAVELFQGWMPYGRERDVWDVLANTVGIAVALVAARLFMGGWMLRMERLLSKVMND